VLVGLYAQLKLKTEEKLVEELVELFLVRWTSVKNKSGSNLVARVAEVDPIGARKDKNKIGNLLIQGSVRIEELIGVP
jgi:hypothetical protein